MNIVAAIAPVNDGENERFGGVEGNVPGIVGISSGDVGCTVKKSAGVIRRRLWVVTAIPGSSAKDFRNFKAFVR